jgi:hypothetical protein
MRARSLVRAALLTLLLGTLGTGALVPNKAQAVSVRIDPNGAP